MASRKTREIENALLSKGFIRSDSNHRFFHLYVDGKRTPIRTYLSHGVSEYGDDLLSKVRQQMKLRSKKELLEFIDCPVTHEDYVEIVREAGLL